jgi:S-adenosylmethionine-diacylgycerolhomoserine-N-methlytransferase
MATRLPVSDPTASLMDGIYRYQRHIYDASRLYYLLGRDRMIAELGVPDGGTVLEIGCGTARNLVAAARRYPRARFHGIDISAEMLKSAEANIRRAGLADRITVARADAAHFDGASLFGVKRFDRIFFSYSLSMIPPWREALAAACGHLAPSGELHTVDFSAQAGLPAWFGRGLDRWLATFHVSPRLDLSRELAVLANARGGHSVTRPIFRDYAVLGRLIAGPLR